MCWYQTTIFSKCGHDRNTKEVIKCSEADERGSECKRIQGTKTHEDKNLVCGGEECNLTRTSCNWTCCQCNSKANTERFCAKRKCRHDVCEDCPPTQQRRQRSKSTDGLAMYAKIEYADSRQGVEYAEVRFEIFVNRQNRK
jgi:hypothetical protein